MTGILRTEERKILANWMESRLPFLDQHFVELTAANPSSAKVRDDDPKLILKDVARGRVPESIINRRKQGFSEPIDSWLLGALGGEVRSFLMDGPAAERGYFDRSRVDALITRAVQKQKDIWRVWSLVTFEMWCRIFIDGEGTE